MKRIFIPFYLVLSGALALGVARAQTKTIKQTPIRPTSSWSGDALYGEYCAVCHGVEGRGPGPAADALKTKPTDLTLIARHHSSKFPEIAVREIIRGQADIPSHGSSEMPVWGEAFRSISPSPAFAEMRINALVRYLQQIQR